MIKRKLAWVLALCTLLTTLCLPVSAAGADLEGEILPVLAVMGVMNGDEAGNLDLNRSVTRAEFVKMAIAASAHKNRGKAPSAISPYPDVRAGAWHSGYITAARDLGLITGYLDGTFRPDNTVTLEEALSILLKIMGYGGTDFAAGWPTAYMTLYHSLGMDEGMTALQGDRLTRRDCAILVYNALNAKAKTGAVYAQQLGYALDSTGKINYASLVRSLTEGPVLLESTVEAAVGFTPVTVNRDRTAASAAQLQYGDVLYYNKDIRAVWAYSTKVSGIVQAISPSTMAPSAVTVSGMTVGLGSSSVIYAFSDLGTVQTGDAVTLLLGAGEQAVFVLTGEAASETVYGVVTSVGTTAQSGGLGTVITQQSVTIAASDGRSYSYPYSKDDLKAGTAVKVTLDRDGVSIRKARDGESLSGKIRGGKLDGCIIEGDTKAIDVLGGRMVKVDAARLEGVSIKSRDVLFAKTDGEGHIEHLILDNVTGDNRDYGVATVAFESPDIMYVPSSYVIMVGTAVKTHSANATYGLEVGPCGIEYKADGAISRLVDLKEQPITHLGAFEAELKDGKEVPLAAGIQVWLEEDGSYYLSSLQQVSLDTHKLTAHYDQLGEDGGRVRVIIAEEK